MIDILYEDNHLIAVNKPVGLLVQGDETGDECLMDQVKDYLKKTYQKPGNVFLGLLHRIDRPAAGIVLFAKTSKGASRLTAQFRGRTIKKVYYALLEGMPKEKKGTLVHYLRKDHQRNIVSAYDEERPDTMEAELSYEVVNDRKGDALVKIDLKTGRPHQIRAQFAAIGHKVFGDKKYGARSKYADGKGIALCATELHFKTATGDKDVDLSVHLPF
jgi:23S rRNA pseudouridine1911/1915/1917 synthase